MREFLKNYTERIKQCLKSLPLDDLSQAVSLMLEASRKENQIIIFGNGGSAAIASHWVCDLAKGLAMDGKPRLRAVSLNDCIPLMTAWANDTSYENVFQEQLVNHLRKGDLVIAISSSGNSPNILRAIEYANEHGAITIGLSGMGGGKLATLVQVPIVVESDEYEEVEDTHLVIAHMLKLALKKELLSST